jgi:hypothetical protein
MKWNRRAGAVKREPIQGSMDSCRSQKGLRPVVNTDKPTTSLYDQLEQLSYRGAIHPDSRAGDKRTTNHVEVTVVGLRIDGHDSIITRADDKVTLRRHCIPPKVVPIAERNQ